jgi:L-lactate dehydrogenase complex protein LldF
VDEVTAPGAAGEFGVLPGHVPLLTGLERAPDLPHASSLCGSCSDACPVKIPLHELLLELRRDLVDDGVASLRERLAFRLWSYAWSSAASYRLSTRLARLGGPFAGLLGPGRAWSTGRALPKLGVRYRDRP